MNIQDFKALDTQSQLALLDRKMEANTPFFIERLKAAIDNKKPFLVTKLNNPELTGIYNDLVSYEPEPDLCGGCSGSGLGGWNGGSCKYCNGTGIRKSI